VDLISIFKEVFEQGLEVTRVHKFLHIVSKIIFYLVMAVFINDFIFSLVPGLTISSQASVISALIIIAFTIALDLSFRTYITYIYAESVSINMFDLREVFSKVESVDVFNFKKGFIEATAEVLEEKLSSPKPLYKIFMKLVGLPLLINTILLPLATLYVINSINYSVEEIIAITPFPTPPYIHTFTLFLIATIIEFLNIDTLIPSPSRSSKDCSEGQDRESGVNILKEFIITSLYINLLRINYRIPLTIQRRYKFVIALPLLIFSNPWDFLLPPTSKREGVGPFIDVESIALVFIPQPELIADPQNSCEKGNAELCDAVSNICNKTFEIINKASKSILMERLDNSCIATLDTSSSSRKSGRKGNNQETSWVSQRSSRVEAAYASLEVIKNNIKQLFQGWRVEFIGFEELTTNLTTNTIENLFTNYSIIDSSLRGIDIDEAIQKIIELHSNEDLLKSLIPISQTFSLILPVVFVIPAQIRSNMVIVFRDESHVPIPTRFYVAIPVLITLNPLAKTEEISQVISKFKKRPSTS
jgi:hypothetical protein